LKEAGKTVGMIGLGNMGLGMASVLVAAGYTVFGFDPAAESSAKAARIGVTLADSAGEVFAKAPIVVLSLPTAAIVDKVVTGPDGVAARASGRCVVIDTSTSEPQASRRLAALLSKNGHGFLDAPVSGGPSGAASGKLAMMIGGAEQDLADARAVIDALATKVMHVGTSGAGNVAKLVNNLLVAAHMLTTSEALKLAQSAGVSAEAALGVINAATGRSAISEIHVPTWVTTERFDSGFSAGLMRKDVRLALAMAAEVGQTLPVGSLIGKLWEESRHTVPDEEDFTRLAALDPAGAKKETSHG